MNRQKPTSPLRNLAKSGKALVEMVQSGIDSAQLNISSALPTGGLLAPVAEGATTNNNGHTINLGGVNITVNGATDAGSVKGAVNDGLLSALRSAGLR